MGRLSEETVEDRISLRRYSYMVSEQSRTGRHREWDLLVANKDASHVVYASSMEVRDRQVVAFNIYTNQERVIENIDMVVFATMKKSDDALYHALKGKVSELHRVGDCVQLRLVMEAIWEGFTVGREV